MNRDRRLRLREAQALLEQAEAIVREVADDERAAFENLPESLQESDRGVEMEETVDALEDAATEIESAASTIVDRIEGLS